MKKILISSYIAFSSAYLVKIDSDPENLHDAGLQFDFSELKSKSYAIISDPQFGNYWYYNAGEEREDHWDEELQNMKDALIHIETKTEADFVIVTGDLTNEYPTNGDERMEVVHKQRNDIFNAIKESPLPVFVLPGNHDTGNDFEQKELDHYTEFWGQDYYYFHHNDILFIIMDSQLLTNYHDDKETKQLAETQLKWLEDLINSEAKNAKQLNVLLHVPIFSFEIDEEDSSDNLPMAYRERVLDLLGVILKI